MLIGKFLFPLSTMGIGFRADLIVENKGILELKSVEQVIFLAADYPDETKEKQVSWGQAQMNTDNN